MKKRRQPLGQNFLVDIATAQEIVIQARIKKHTHVVEIGPGKGVLTHDLIGPAKKITVIEIDPMLCRILEKKYGNQPKFKLEQADALKVDYSSLGSRFKIVSNLPYYVATPIIKRLINYQKHIEDMTLMLQKEVAERMTAVPGTRDYGSLTVFVQFHCEAEQLMQVKKDCFFPEPKVDSTVIRLTPRKAPPIAVANEKNFFHLVHAAFLHKRKTLRNNLKGLNGSFQVDLSKIEAAGIDLGRRAEELNLEEFAKISNTLETTHA